MCCHHSSFLLTIDHRIRLIVASQLSSFSSPFLRSHRHHLPPSPHESRLSSLVCVPNHSLEWAHRLIVTRAMRSIHWCWKGSTFGLAIVFDLIDLIDRSSTAAGSSRWWWCCWRPSSHQRAHYVWPHCQQIFRWASISLRILIGMFWYPFHRTFLAGISSDLPFTHYPPSNKSQMIWRGNQEYPISKLARWTWGIDVSHREYFAIAKWFSVRKRPFLFTCHSLNTILPRRTIIFNYPPPLLPNHLADCHISPSWLTTSTFFRLEITSYHHLRSSVFFKILHAHLLQVYCIYSVQSLTWCILWWTRRSFLSF